MKLEIMVFHSAHLILPIAVPHCSIFDEKASNAMNVNEHFFRIGHYLAQIDNILNAFGHSFII